MRPAAVLLGITPGGLSKSLKVLEQELGFSLFVLQGRGLTLSDQARAFLPRAEACLKEVERLLSGEPARPALRLGTFEVFSTHLLPAILAGLEGDLLVKELLPGRMEEAVAKGLVDVALTYEPVPYEGVEHLKVARFPMGVYAIPGVFDSLPPAEVPFAAPALPLEGAASGARGLDGWPEEKLRRNVTVRVDLLESALALVRAGKCAVFLPGPVARAHGGMVELPGFGKARVVRDVFLVKRLGTPEDARLKRLAKNLRGI